MKKVLLFSTLFLTVNFIDAQSNSDRNKGLALFVNQANMVMSSDMSINSKENQIVRLAGNFLAEFKTIDEIKDTEKFEDEFQTCQQCDVNKIKKYITMIGKRNGNTSFVSQRTINSFKGQEDNKELSAAIKIYEKIGTNNISSNQECETGNCDNDNFRNPKSRGKTTDIWMYTGQKKFFINDNIKGWRYFCKYVKANDEDPLNTHSENDKYGWKRKENVDKW